ncbi:MAG: branched-chain amino acid ABC transporter permease [Faecousia sp.]
MIFRQIINGLQSGSVYALVAIGYSMVYGIISLLNFAHGDIIMVGAYILWATMVIVNPYIAMLLAIIGCTLLGVVIEKVAYKPLRKSPRISLLITAIGVSYLLQNVAQLDIFLGAGKQDVSAIKSYIAMPDLHLGGDLTISGVAVITLLITAISMVGLTLLVNKTKMGKAMRAVSEDTDAAQLMGININHTISFTFAIGSALAGIGSVLYCAAYPQVGATMGSMLGLKAFVAAVLGGIGSIPGAMIGGLVIGLVEALVSTIGLSTWKDGIVFAILIVVLLVKPTGILGRNVTEKV